MANLFFSSEVPGQDDNSQGTEDSAASQATAPLEDDSDDEQSLASDLDDAQEPESGEESDEEEEYVGALLVRSNAIKPGN